MEFNREDVKNKFLSKIYSKNLNYINRAISQDRMSDRIFDNIIDDLCDINKRAVGPCDEIETFILRKSFGIIDAANSVNNPITEISHQQVNTIENKCYSKIVKYCYTSYIFSLDNLSDEILNAHINNFTLSTRTYNSLVRSRISTINDIISHTKKDIMWCRNMGTRSFEELEKFIHKLGLSFADEKKCNINDSVEEKVNNSINNLKSEKDLLIEEFNRLLNEREELINKKQQLDNKIDMVVGELINKGYIYEKK